MVNSFNGSKKDMQRELNSMASAESVDPYWGRPVEGLDEQPLSLRETMADETDTRNDEVIPDMKLGQLFKHHLKDWLVIVLLIILDVVLNIIHPFNRYVGSMNIDSVRFPHKKNTVPVWSVPIYAVLLPILIFIGYFFKRRDVRDLHHAILGILTAALITAVLTDSIKDGVGRPRPDFFWRCFPDGFENYDMITREVICSGDPAVIREGYKSFPSGHTSWSFAGLGYLSFYLAGKLVIFDRRGFTWRLSLVVLPLLAAALVAVSRVDDYWHHWQDVTAGGLLGFFVAYFCYKQHFPDFSDEKAGYPYPYIPLVSVPLASHASQHGSQHPIHNTRPRVNGGSYDLENGRM
ncbi:diacylglycerol diphosphate phosphatase / phosphatidate phosphatase [Marchantia polymorpha subsp. ruderalis]|uniref:Phosphatidic acid phosphatase type 2/haloperoxidase domain-containing protein n=2 Tax=Marchantia polymorpha TaxID=3197 RepID=A0A176VMI8_MARPO|nr:hypothetical protein AXG93_2619s1010 [Marchantia polymorpha subsp. ruderalis]PTQ29300.1 hypothetical protein MARPO_0144s0019 [Marchantia polymorpha]BBN15092.1 hypothetical protein Mp_6g16950 [Marchantia polymorpha subsp. ruderalis]|eukprot:PTQ29300.1 hypothetical protein MARPO_0144s0019 [Marchantia polymorpha]